MQIPTDALTPAPPEADALTPGALSEQLGGVAIHPDLAAYLTATAAAAEVRGGFRLLGAAGALPVGLPLDPWAAAFDGADVPAVALGSDGFGHTFWVHAPTARVISIHHDSLDERAALPKHPERAAEQLLSWASSLDLAELVALHLGLADTPDHPVAVLHASCDALQLSAAALADRLDQEAALAFLWIRARELLEDEGVASVAEARDTLRSLATTPSDWARKRSLSLANAWLTQLPEALLDLTRITTLDLSVNPELDLDAALQQLSTRHKLRDLTLARNGLRQLPEALLSLKHLKKLNLSGNPLTSLPDLGALPRLERLDLRDTWIDDPDHVQVPPGCAVYVTRSVYPSGLGRAQANPEGTRTIDLSIGYSDDDALIDQLPPLRRFPNLTTLRLAFQRELAFSAILRNARDVALTKLDLRHIPIDAHNMDLDDLHAQPHLEALRYGGNFTSRGATLPITEVLRYAAEHPSLRVLECLPPYDWREPFPETHLEELHLSGLSDPWDDDDEDEPPAIPPGLGRQRHLRALTLSGTTFTLPDDLPPVRELHAHAAVTNPERIVASCPSLTALTLNASSDAPLPDLSPLTELRRVTMQSNSSQARQLLEQLHALPAIETVELEEFHPPNPTPPSIWGATTLRHLKLHARSAYALPAGLARLQRLESLDLFNLQPPPDPSDFALPALRRLHYISNHEQPVSTEHLDALLTVATLEDLKLIDRCLPRLPESLARQTQLKRLTLGPDTNINLLGDAADLLGELSALEELELSVNYVTRVLPDALTRVPLRRLTLSSVEHLDWTHTFELLAAIPTLRELTIQWCDAPVLPDAVARLTQLRALTVHQSKTRKIPRAITELTRLQRLQVSASPWPAAERRKIKRAMPWCACLFW